MIQEGAIKLNITLEDKISRKMEVFYNPIMELNRTISILLLKNQKRKLKIALPMAGSGIRAARFLKEAPEIIDKIYINDISPTAIKKIKATFRTNKIPIRSAKIYNQDANSFLLKNKHFDYIDIDPFGSPNKFLDASIKSIRTLKPYGIIALTATDTAPLSGTYPKACKRKYYANPIRNEHKHEMGLRILIRKAQLIAAQYEIALNPILAYSKDHYFRVYLEARKGKQLVDMILKDHQFFHYCPKCGEFSISKFNQDKCCMVMQSAGPLYIGSLFNVKLEPINKFIEILNNEQNLIGFYDIHRLAKIHKLKFIPPKKQLLAKIGKETHFIGTAIKTEKKLKEILKIIQSLS